jgi:hypothetical protein
VGRPLAFERGCRPGSAAILPGAFTIFTPAIMLLGSLWKASVVGLGGLLLACSMYLAPSAIHPWALLQAISAAGW